MCATELTKDNAGLGEVIIRLSHRAILAIGCVVQGAFLQVSGNADLCRHVLHTSLAGRWIEGQVLVGSAVNLCITNTEGQESRDQIRKRADAV